MARQEEEENVTKMYLSNILKTNYTFHLKFKTIFSLLSVAIKKITYIEKFPFNLFQK